MAPQRCLLGSFAMGVACRGRCCLCDGEGRITSWLVSFQDAAGNSAPGTSSWTGLYRHRCGLR